MTNLSTDFIPFSRPVMGREEEEAVIRVLRSGWLTTGPETKAFEEEFRQYIQVPHALAVNSATSGLHLALEALGIGPGDKVAVPTYTFTATAEVVRYLGADPVFVDCAPGSFQMSMDSLGDLAARIPLKAVMAVHLAGEPCDLEALSRLKARHGFSVVEDCAHSFPVRTPQGWLGTLFDVGVFSFYANKTMTTGEGGMAVTSRPELAERMARMRLHGINRDAFSRFTDRKASWEYDIVAPGYKYNLPDLGGALGRVQLKKAQGFLTQRQEAVKGYLEALGGREGYILPAWREDHAWHLFLLRTADPEDRDPLIRWLSDAGIGTSVHYIPLHRMTYWKQTYALAEEDFPEAEAAFKSVVSLPLYPSLTPRESPGNWERVIDALKSFPSRKSHGQK